MLPILTTFETILIRLSNFTVTEQFSRISSSLKLLDCKINYNAVYMTYSGLIQESKVFCQLSSQTFEIRIQLWRSYLAHRNTRLAQIIICLGI